jgi:uncharacterized repeat protein (TIGR03803 family)
MGYGTRIAFGALRRVCSHFCLLVAAAAFIFAGGASPARAQVMETVLWSFSGGIDGSSPNAGVVADERGALYGTTGFGGTFSAGCVRLGCGTVFKLMPPADGQTAWTKTLLASFSGGSDGDEPFGVLFARNEAPSPKKTLYGTTSGLAGEFGEAANATGTVFRLSDGSLTTLWNFTGGGDGANPFAGLIADEKTGTLYGTAQSGGAFGAGTVFKIDTIDRTLTTIYSFSGGNDGGGPQAPLIADEQGALHGTTTYGGNSTAPICTMVGNGSCGVVFKLTPPARGPTTWTETTIWTFSGGDDGAVPILGGLIADETGALYGTTSAGGPFPAGCNAVSIGCGTVFKLTPPAAGQTAWTLVTLWSFTGGNDGGFPVAGLIADGKRALYGTTYIGGAFGPGVVFKLAPSAVAGQTPWIETTLWNFNGSDGALPQSTLIADHNGTLYGTTQFGGNPSCAGGFGCGVVFKLTGTGFLSEDEE